MQISTILSPEAIRVVSAISSKKRLFVELGELAHTVYKMSASRTVEALLEREGLGPTAVGHGIALPHARIDDAQKVCGLFLRIERPMDFDSADRKPVDLVFALFAPSSAGVEHLKALALVSRTLRDPDLCTKLRANNDPAVLHVMLTENSASKAA